VKETFMARKKKVTEKEKTEMMKKLKTRFGDGRGLVAQILLDLSLSGQPCDVTFLDRPAALDVVIDQKIGLALMYGAGAKKLQEMLEEILLSNGDVVSFGKIWMILPMPVGGISKNDLAAVDLSDGEERFGPKGETIREMIRNLYHCKSREEEEDCLRRYLAS
jgi:hypothetical protein